MLISSAIASISSPSKTKNCKKFKGKICSHSSFARLSVSCSPFFINISFSLMLGYLLHSRLITISFPSSFNISSTKNLFSSFFMAVLLNTPCQPFSAFCPKSKTSGENLPGLLLFIKFKTISGTFLLSLSIPLPAKSNFMLRIKLVLPKPFFPKSK